MALIRILILLLLFSAVVSFACFAVKGQPRFKLYGLTVLKWTLIGAFGFFGVLILDRLA
ncbi:MAG: hypothetical protein WAU15_05535 [Nitrosomonas sp.]